MFLSFAAGAVGPGLVFSTHDWTATPQGSVFPFAREVWADVKMPGGFPDTVIGSVTTAENRRTYMVGTVEVDEVDELSVPPTQFSEADARPASSSSSIMQGFTGASKRQVVIVQANEGDAANGSNAIQWQRFYYGTTPLGPTDPFRHTNARAISVWEDGDLLDARIAICGETYDEELPLSNSPWPQANDSHASGFIAVLDGRGELLFSHHLWAGTNGSRDCAVTDLSVRVDANGRTIVTYCGISSHGDPGSGNNLSPLRPFQNQPMGFASGMTTQPAGQWDGFVGRLIYDAGVVQPQFHSIVAGPDQDGLFGLAEVDEDRFVVVGSTMWTADTASNHPALMALTTQTGAPFPNPGITGIVLGFDASAVAGGGDLLLAMGTTIGGLDAEGSRHTILRDVYVTQVASATLATDVSSMIYTVGSTDDPTVFGGIGITGVPNATISGPTDGLLVGLQPYFQPPLLGIMEPRCGTYMGGSGHDGLTGVQSWSEFPEYVAVTGFSEQVGATEIAVGSYYFNNADGPPVPSGFTGPAHGTFELTALRAATIGGNGDSRPAAMGTVNATDVGLSFVTTSGLGSPAGGGVAVGENGRCNTVGSTTPVGSFSGYPIFGSQWRPGDYGVDAVRSEWDLLPSFPGFAPVLGIAGRTDGTGFQPSSTAFPPASPFTGGTTPFCALNEFGSRVGGTPNSNGLRRMLIDVEGDVSPGSTDVAFHHHDAQPRVSLGPRCSAAIGDPDHCTDGLPALDASWWLCLV